MATENPYSSPSSDVTSDMPANNYKVLRVVNWFFAILTFPSLVVLFISTSEYSAKTLAPLAALIIYCGNFAATAIIIKPGIPSFLYFPLILSDTSIKLITVTLLVINFLFTILGAVIIIACFVTSQYPASIVGFIYLFLSIFNLRALWSQKNA